MPQVLSNLGYDHFGDPDNFNGYLFVPVQTPHKYRDKNDNPVSEDDSSRVGEERRKFPVIAVFDENTLEFIDCDTLNNRSQGGWVTINPITKELYTSVSTITSQKPIDRYSINWSKLQLEGKLELNREGPFHINYNALPMTGQKRV